MKKKKKKYQEYRKVLKTTKAKNLSYQELVQEKDKISKEEFFTLQKNFYDFVSERKELLKAEFIKNNSFSDEFKKQFVFFNDENVCSVFDNLFESKDVLKKQGLQKRLFLLLTESASVTNHEVVLMRRRLYRLSKGVKKIYQKKRDEDREKFLSLMDKNFTDKEKRLSKGAALIHNWTKYFIQRHTSSLNFYLYNSSPLGEEVIEEMIEIQKRFLLSEGEWLEQEIVQKFTELCFFGLIVEKEDFFLFLLCAHLFFSTVNYRSYY